jgi:tetratricopeptide (TPR) repeat protein
MSRSSLARTAIAVSLALTSYAPAVHAQWPPKQLTNLKVLPADTPPAQLIDLMGQFTRALGVRCTYCHVGDENLPLSTYHFADDDKVTKRKARVMMRMVNEVNGQYLATLEDRAKPAIQVQCITCHHGVTVPRTLESVLFHAYEVGGLDSTLATYRGLRERYYGRAAYDFGSVPLADVASDIEDQGHPADAVAVNALNVEMNPESEFARRQYAAGALLQAFRHDPPDSATALYHRLRARYGDSVYPEFALNRIGYTLLGEDKVTASIAAFQLCVEAFPKSGNSYDSLGDAYAKNGDRALAIQSYEKAMKLSPSDATKEKLKALRKEGTR